MARSLGATCSHAFLIEGARKHSDAPRIARHMQQYCVCADVRTLRGPGARMRGPAIGECMCVCMCVSVAILAQATLAQAVCRDPPPDRSPAQAGAPIPFAGQPLEAVCGHSAMRRCRCALWRRSLAAMALSTAAVGSAAVAPAKGAAEAPAHRIRPVVAEPMVAAPVVARPAVATSLPWGRNLAFTKRRLF